MGCSKKSDMSLVVVVAAMVVAVVVLAGATVVEGQATPACASQLVPCVNYLNTTTKPPDTCCTPLKETIEKQRDCLCNLYNSPGFLQSLGINVTQALALPKFCGINDTVSACVIKGSGSASPPTSSVTPPGVPGSDGSNGASKMMAWAGISTLVSPWVLFVILY